MINQKHYKHFTNSDKIYCVYTRVQVEKKRRFFDKNVCSSTSSTLRFIHLNTEFIEEVKSGVPVQPFLQVWKYEVITGGQVRRMRCEAQFIELVRSDSAGWHPCIVLFEEFFFLRQIRSFFLLIVFEPVQYIGIIFTIVCSFPLKVKDGD